MHTDTHAQFIMRGVNICNTGRANKRRGRVKPWCKAFLPHTRFTHCFNSNLSTTIHTHTHTHTFSLARTFYPTLDFTSCLLNNSFSLSQKLIYYIDVSVHSLTFSVSLSLSDLYPQFNFVLMTCLFSCIWNVLIFELSIYPTVVLQSLIMTIYHGFIILVILNIRVWGIFD